MPRWLYKGVVTESWSFKDEKDFYSKHKQSSVKPLRNVTYIILCDDVEVMKWLKDKVEW